MSKKMTKAELRHDPIREELEKIVNFIIKPDINKKEKQIGAGILVIIAIGIFYYFSSRPKYDANAQLMLIQSMETMYNISDTTSAKQVEAFLTRLTQQYGNTLSGKKAFYYLGVLYYKKGNKKKAQQYFQKFLKFSIPDPLLKASAKGYLGTIYMDTGDYTTAFRMVYEAYQAAPLKSLKAFYLYRAANIKEMQKSYIEAVSLYKELTEKFPASTFVRDARTELDYLSFIMKNNKKG